MAYQGYGQGADRARSRRCGTAGIVPDVTLVLDVSDAVAVARQLNAVPMPIAMSGSTRCSMRG